MGIEIRAVVRPRTSPQTAAANGAQISSLNPAGGSFHTGLFSGKPVLLPVRPRLKRPPRQRKRKLRPWTGRPGSLFAE